VNSPDIIIVGTGPSGISAAWPLVESGARVLLVDAGEARLARPRSDRPSLPCLRAAGDGWKDLLGSNLAALRDVGFASPKLRTAAPPEFGGDFVDGNGILAEGFRPVGAHAWGGLSNLWGAASPCYGPEDMAGWPITPADLAPSYQAVAARIGLSGSADDDLGPEQGMGLALQPPSPMTGAVARLFERYGARGSGGNGLRLGAARNAVLSRDLGERRGCTRCKGCMWGCPQGAIYNSADDLARLLERPNVRLDAGVLVHDLRRRPEGGWDLLGRQGGAEKLLQAPRVVLAAGPLASTRLALAAIGDTGAERPLVTAPCFAFALMLPSRLGRRLDEEGFGMAQLAFHLPLPGHPDEAIFGSLYEADGFAVADMAAGLPLTRRGAATLLGVLMPSLVVGLGYFPGTWSANRVRLTADGGLAVTGALAEGHPAAFRRVGVELRRGFRRLGAWMLPGSFKPFMPGTEVHYAGSLAMGRDTDCAGELIAAPDLFVADGSVLPGVSAKHHTFTVMANADRIGRLLAGRR
jgi:choline dehydrogenase-like flavoprotein